MTFYLNSEEHDMVEKALKKVAQEMGQSLGCQEVEAKEVLLLLAQRILETNVADGCPGARVEREESLYTILYHLCPECRSAKLSRPEGLVDIPTELVERVEGEAKKVSISPEEEASKSGDWKTTSECETSAPEKPIPKEERDRPNSYTISEKTPLTRWLYLFQPLLPQASRPARPPYRLSLVWRQDRSLQRDHGLSPIMPRALAPWPLKAQGRATQGS